MPTQVEKGAAFHALHTRHSAFIIPNPWDVGAARALAQVPRRSRRLSSRRRGDAGAWRFYICGGGGELSGY